MNNQELFQLVRRADPLGATDVSEYSPEALLERVSASARSESHESRPRAARRHRIRLLVTAALALGAVSAGLAIGATGWLSGEPAPQAVVTDFEAYQQNGGPQLGFHPDPGSAVLVAQDGDISLYATTNQEGTYCLILDGPWGSATRPPGGTCFPAFITSEHLIAGMLGGPREQANGWATFVVGGRTDDSTAKTIRFTNPDGEVIERPVGASGFFIARVETQVPQTCAAGGWTPTFTALDANGKEVAEVTIPLMKPATDGRAGDCVFSGLRSS
jgi:hypothetical protein